MKIEESAESGDIKKLKHDIRNQLSNITLALEQLKYEIPDKPNEFDIYFEMISSGARNINMLLNNL